MTDDFEVALEVGTDIFNALENIVHRGYFFSIKNKIVRFSGKTIRIIVYYI